MFLQHSSDCIGGFFEPDSDFILNSDIISAEVAATKNDDEANKILEHEYRILCQQPFINKLRRKIKNRGHKNTPIKNYEAYYIRLKS